MERGGGGGPPTLIDSHPKGTEMRFATLFAVLGILFASPLQAATPATGKPPERIVVIVDGIAALRNFPVVVAERLGYLKNDEFDVTVMDIRPDVDIDEMVMDGRADASIAYYHHAISAHAKGTPMEAIATLGVTPGAKIMVANRARAKIKSPNDLRGARFIAGGPFSAKTTVANAFVLSGGLAVGDYVRMAPEDKASIAAMLRNGEADLVVARTPDASFYEAQGVAEVMADLTTVEGTRQALGSLFPTNAVYMTSAKIKAHPRMAQHLATAFVRTLRYLRSHSAAEIAALIPEEISGTDKAAYIAALAESLAMYQTDGRMPDGGADYELGVLKAAIPAYAAVKASQTYTNRFIDKALVEPATE